MGFQEVFMPVPMIPGSKLNAEESGKRKIDLDLINTHYLKILQSDCILVTNFEKNGIKDYIGGNTFLEMGFAFVNKRPIFILNAIPDMAYKSEIIGMKPTVLNSDFRLLRLFFGRH